MSKKKNEQEVSEYILDKTNNQFSYYFGYRSIDSEIYIKCNKCGAVTKRSMISIRHTYKAKVICRYCERNRTQQEKEKIKYVQWWNKKASALETKYKKCNITLNKLHWEECKECGKKYIAYAKNDYYCSAKCAKRYMNNRKDRRLTEENTIDKDITLKKLYRRDKGICYICGGKCDYNDITNGIAGDNYPSIEHVVAIANGGLHSWDNVKLAHRRCNYIKSDKDIHAPLVEK